MNLAFRCLICTALIPEARALRGGRTCNNDCAREAKRRLRQRRSEIRCRLCGRPNRQRKLLDHVRGAHNPTDATVGFPQERAS